MAINPNPFALNFYQQMAGRPEQNFIFSPYSIWLALTMVYAGARGATAAQVQQALQVGENPHQAVQTLNRYIRAGVGRAATATRAELNIANGLWVQKALSFENAYLELLAQFYESTLAQVDFRNPTQVARQINKWVATETRNKIRDLIPPKALSPLSTLVLVNAIYFKGKWKRPFQEKATRPEPFYLLNGKTLDVPTMVQTESFLYAETDKYIAVEMPYTDEEMAMVLVMPTDDFAAFEMGWGSEKWAEIQKGVAGLTKIRLHVPQFEMTTRLSLAEGLRAIGIVEAFDPNKADFSGMVRPTNTPFFISDAIHQAYVKVDEVGTEAAAATAIVMVLGAMIPQMPPEVRFDHPFLYAIYHKPTHAILFMGRVMNPAA